MIIEQKIIKKEWVHNLVLTFGTLFLLMIIGNLISGFMRPNVETYEVLVNQLLIAPSTIIKILPVSCLITSLLTINNLIKTNQLVAIYATGTSPMGIAKKILLFALFVGAMNFLIGGYLKPYSLKLKNKIIPNLYTKFRHLKADGLISTKISNGKMWIKKDNQFLKYKNFNFQNKSLQQPSIYEVNEKGNLTKKLNSKELIFKNKWDGKSSILVENIQKDIPTLQLNENKLKLKTSIKDLEKFEQDITTLNFKKLLDYTENLDRSGINSTKYKILYLGIITSTINCILFSLLGLGSLYSPNKRSSSGGVIALTSLVFVIIFWLLEGYLLELGKSLKLNIFLSTFSLQAILLILITVIFIRKKAS